MENKNSVINVVKFFESSEFITVDQLERTAGLKLQEENHQDGFDDFMGKVDSDHKVYKGTDIQTGLGVSSLKTTEIINVPRRFVAYLEIKLHKSISIDEIKKVWGSEYKLIVNRPEFPVGDRCVAQYTTATSRLEFGFSDCENMADVIKVSVTKIANGDL